MKQFLLITLHAVISTPMCISNHMAGFRNENRDYSWNGWIQSEASRKGDLSKLLQQKQVPRASVSGHWDNIEKLQCLRVPRLSGKPEELLEEKIANKQFEKELGKGLPSWCDYKNDIKHSYRKYSLSWKKPSSSFCHSCRAFFGFSNTSDLYTRRHLLVLGRQ